MEDELERIQTGDGKANLIPTIVQVKDDEGTKIGPLGMNVRNLENSQ